MDPAPGGETSKDSATPGSGGTISPGMCLCAPLIADHGMKCSLRGGVAAKVMDTTVPGGVRDFPRTRKSNQIYAASSTKGLRFEIPSLIKILEVNHGAPSTFAKILIVVRLDVNSIASLAKIYGPLPNFLR